MSGLKPGPTSEAKANATDRRRLTVYVLRPTHRDETAMNGAPELLWIGVVMQLYWP